MRLYFWFRGAPADRPGGPWWVETYEPARVSWAESPLVRRDRMLGVLRPFLHAYALTDGSEPLAANNEPPPDAVILCQESAA